MEVIMWIRTQGGYLLNLDKMEHIGYNPMFDKTMAYDTSHKPEGTHVIAEGNHLETITNNIARGTAIMEVL
jgi:hypothetical protein